MKIIKPNMALGSKPTIISRARIYERKKKMIKKKLWAHEYTTSPSEYMDQPKIQRISFDK